LRRETRLAASLSKLDSGNEGGVSASLDWDFPNTNLRE
jgi:hypothetical protein